VKPGAKISSGRRRAFPCGSRSVRGTWPRAHDAARRTVGKAPLKLEGIVAAVAGRAGRDPGVLLQAARERREANSVRGVTKAQFLEFMKRERRVCLRRFCGDGGVRGRRSRSKRRHDPRTPRPEFRSPQARRPGMWCGKPSVAEAVWRSY